MCYEAPVYIVGWQSRTNRFFNGRVSLKWIQGIKHNNIFEIQSSKLQLQLSNWSFNQNSFRYHHALLIPVGTHDQWSKSKWHWFEHTGAEYFPWTSKHVSCTSIVLTLPCKKCTVQPLQQMALTEAFTLYHPFFLIDLFRIKLWCPITCTKFNIYVSIKCTCFYEIHDLRPHYLYEINFVEPL
jgi:hypothetical protein